MRRQLLQRRLPGRLPGKCLRTAQHPLPGAQLLGRQVPRHTGPPEPHGLSGGQAGHQRQRLSHRPSGGAADDRVQDGVPGERRHVPGAPGQWPRLLLPLRLLQRLGRCHAQGHGRPLHRGRAPVRRPRVRPDAPGGRRSPERGLPPALTRLAPLGPAGVPHPAQRRPGPQITVAGRAMDESVMHGRKGPDRSRIRRHGARDACRTKGERRRLPRTDDG
ncbi:hypothetical protein SGPA1_40043 [Streptomyces misionensis JCM 4497]